MSGRVTTGWLAVGAFYVGVAGATLAATPDSARPDRPSVLLITIDTLRADRLGSAGYSRNTSPNLDRLLAAGVHFREARTPEPLTAPAMVSLLTSLDPHEHGATRNGLPMRADLDSLPKLLREAGFRTAAATGNWTLTDKLSGLGEHFETYDEVLTRKRWFGLFQRESTADDLNEHALAWLEDHVRRHAEQPFFLWIHYVEPHAPYRFHAEWAQALGIDGSGPVPPGDRYDTEIAYVDAQVGRLLERVRALLPAERTIVALASDHGESLGEHNYWGHGRHLYETNLHVPMAIVWPGRLEARAIDAPAMLLDIAPTIVSLAGLDSPRAFRGYDWTPVLRGAPPPTDRVTHHQAHKGAVLSRDRAGLARRSGLLEVGFVRGHDKEIYRIRSKQRARFDLAADPVERTNLSTVEAAPTPYLTEWMRRVYGGLHGLDDELPAPLDEESIGQLRSLGYVD